MSTYDLTINYHYTYPLNGTWQVRARSIAGPAAEPISLAEARLWLRQDVPGYSGDTSQDGLLNKIITMARQMCEMYIDKAIGSQTILAVTRGLPGGVPLPLPLGPVRDLTSIEYRASPGAGYTTMDPSYYVQDSFDGSIVLASGKAWPAIDYGSSDAVRIRYEAGLVLPTESASEVERLGEDVIGAMRLLLAHLWFNRGAVVEGHIAVELPLGVQFILNPHRASVGL